LHEAQGYHNKYQGKRPLLPRPAIPDVKADHFEKQNSPFWEFHNGLEQPIKPKTLITGQLQGLQGLHRLVQKTKYFWQVQETVGGP